MLPPVHRWLAIAGGGKHEAYCGVVVAWSEMAADGMGVTCRVCERIAAQAAVDLVAGWES